MFTHGLLYIAKQVSWIFLSWLVLILSLLLFVVVLYIIDFLFSKEFSQGCLFIYIQRLVLFWEFGTQLLLECTNRTRFFFTNTVIVSGF